MWGIGECRKSGVGNRMNGVGDLRSRSADTTLTTEWVQMSAMQMSCEWLSGVAGGVSINEKCGCGC